MYYFGVQGPRWSINKALRFIFSKENIKNGHQVGIHSYGQRRNSCGQFSVENKKRGSIPNLWGQNPNLGDRKTFHLFENNLFGSWF